MALLMDLAPVPLLNGPSTVCRGVPGVAFRTGPNPAVAFQGPYNLRTRCRRFLSCTALS